MWRLSSWFSPKVLPVGCHGSGSVRVSMDVGCQDIQSHWFRERKNVQDCPGTGRVTRTSLCASFFSSFLMGEKKAQKQISSVHTRCIVKTSRFTRGVCKNRGILLNFSRFSCGIPREQAILRKSKALRESPEKRTFLSLAFYNAPSLHTVEQNPPPNPGTIPWNSL